MKLGIQLLQTGPQASAENIVRMAQHAEELGYDSLWTFERTLWPINPQNPYPASADGKLPETVQIVFDPLETMTFVAAHTKRVRLGTSVLVLGYHNPLQLARRISTLDVLSGGRVDVGTGSGSGNHTYERAARFGAGWNPSGIQRLDTLEQSIKEFHKTASNLGSSNRKVVLRVFTMLLDSSPGEGRAPMIGTLDQLKEDYKRLRDIGVTELMLTPAELGFTPGTDIEPGLRRMEQLIEIAK